MQEYFRTLIVHPRPRRKTMKRRDFLKHAAITAAALQLQIN
jgi:hypothetical protein